MKISEKKKFEELVIKYWKSRFEAYPKVTKKRLAKELNEAEIAYIEELYKLRSQGFNIYAISELLKALIEQETGYHRAKKIIEKYEKALNCLAHYQNLYGVEECIKILQLHKFGWENHIKKWKSKRTPSKKGAKFIRSHLVHLLVGGSKALAMNHKTKLIYNLSKACSKVSQLIQLLGITNKKKNEDKEAGLEQETLQKDYSKWLKSKVPYVDCRIVTKKNGERRFEEKQILVSPQEIALDPLL